MRRLLWAFLLGLALSIAVSPLITEASVTEVAAGRATVESAVSRDLGPTPAEYEERLELIRMLMLVGFVLSIYLVYDFRQEDARNRPKPATPPRDGFCPLHKSDPADCEDKHR